jgi:transposase InsO family protein
LDKVNRQFKAQRPNQLWVSDFTYVSTWQGWLYVAFVIDVFARRIADGESVTPCAPTSSSMRWSRRYTHASPSATVWCAKGDQVAGRVQTDWADPFQA